MDFNEGLKRISMKQAQGEQTLPTQDSAAAGAPPAPFQRPADNLIIELNPGQCRPWTYHDRSRSHLNPGTCRSLLESIRSQKRNQQPIIVRTIDEPNARYEIVAGVRRHWCVSHLVQQGDTTIRLFGVIRDDLDDREAFQVLDLENRQREDISPYERAHAYLKTIPSLYSSWSDLAAAIGMTRAAISTYKTITELDPDILIAYASPHDLTTTCAREITKTLRDKQWKTLILQRARSLQKVQRNRIAQNEEPLRANQVRQRLLQKKRTYVRPETTNYKTPSGELLATLTRSPTDNGTAVRITFTEHPTPNP